MIYNPYHFIKNGHFNATKVGRISSQSRHCFYDSLLGANWPALVLRNLDPIYSSPAPLLLRQQDALTRMAHTCSQETPGGGWAAGRDASSRHCCSDDTGLASPDFWGMQGSLRPQCCFSHSFFSRESNAFRSFTFPKW